MTERTNDATKAIVEVQGTPARSYANEQEALFATAKQQVRDEQTVSRILAHSKDGQGLYEAHS